MNPRPYAVLADDDERTVEAFVNILTSRSPSLRIVSARSGEEALDFLRGRGRFDGKDPQHPAVIFADMDLPGLDGLELLREVRADSDLKGIPFVLLAASLDVAKLEKGYEWGANAHAVKPIEPRQFINFVRTLGDFWLSINRPPAGVGRRVQP